VKERGMIFNGEMVRAIIEGRKTQTRRPLHPRAVVHANGFITKLKRFSGIEERFHPYQYPYGQIGDRIYVRETHQFVSPDEEWRDIKECNILYRATDEKDFCGYCACEYAEHMGLSLNSPAWESDVVYPWRPSIHMPKWASRIMLEITDIRVERVQDISSDDAIDEGLSYHKFINEWHKIYKNWKDNPWVWVIEFKVINQ